MELLQKLCLCFGLQQWRGEAFCGDCLNPHRRKKKKKVAIGIHLLFSDDSEKEKGYQDFSMEESSMVSNFLFFDLLYGIMMLCSSVLLVLLVLLLQ